MAGGWGPWRSAANPDPLRALSPPFDPAQAGLPDPDGWSFALETSYFNVWGVSGDITGLHRELHRERQRVGDDELAELELRNPGGSSFLVDLEGWRADLVVTRGLASRLGLSLRVPFLDVGRPHWDGIAERWHSALGLPNADRDVFPTGETLLVLRGRRGTIVRRGLAGSGLGDVSVGLVAALGPAFGGVHRMVALLEVPTGRRDTLRGSGGWDLGLRWFGLWHRGRFDVLGGAGFSRLDPQGSLLGLQRADLWHAMAGLDWRLGAGIAASVRSTYESSPLADHFNERPARPAWFNRFGLTAELGRGLWLAVDTGQDTASGLAPDFSFHLTLGTSR